METTTNKGQIYIIVVTIAVLALACVSTICTLSYLGKEVPPELNTLAGGTVGYLAAMLVKTSPTESTKQVAVQDQPVVVPVEPEKPKP